MRWSYMFREWSVALVLKDLVDKFCICFFLHLYDFVSLAHVPSQHFWFFCKAADLSFIILVALLCYFPNSAISFLRWGE